MAPVTPRLERWVRAEFGAAADAVLVLLAKVPDGVPGGRQQDPERLQAALVLSARGDVHRVASGVVTAATDWRDLLVGSGLADADWPARLDAELGTRSTGLRGNFWPGPRGRRPR